VEAFDDMHISVGAVKAGFVHEVRRIHDQGVAVPMTNGVAVPQAHIRREMRAAIQRNDAGVMNHLDIYRYLILCLNDPVVTVVIVRSHRRRSGGKHEALIS
jgi:hypothetical protein